MSDHSTGKGRGVMSDLRKLTEAEKDRAVELLYAIACGPKDDVCDELGEAQRLLRKNPEAAKLGSLGGAKGGPARAKALSPARRSEIALKAAQKRWGHNIPPK